MEYHEAAGWLFDLRRYSPRTGVEHTRHLLAHLGDPDDDLRCIQVAGSNGKGSTARMVERVLREDGLHVGLYTSPHLDDVRERIRVDGRKMPKSAVSSFVADAREYIAGRGAVDSSPTFFETLTAMALWEFARQDVDIAVLEVGIGGRHDATSAVEPEASAVTSVTLEHADLLGDTESEIARDKAQVATAANPLVTATTGEALAAIRDEVEDVLTVGGADADVTVTYEGREGPEGAVTLDGPDWHVKTRLPLVGEHQTLNAGVAAALCRQVASVPESAIRRGLRNAHWPGRFEVFGQHPLIVLDGAHNPGGCVGLASTLDEFEYNDLHLVVGVMSDKDHDGMVAALPQPTVAYACRPAVSRAETTDVLAAAFTDRADDVIEIGDVAAAVDAAVQAADTDDAVVVAGSLFTVAEARRRWTAVEIPKRVTDVETSIAVLEDANVPESDVRRVHDSGVHRVLRVTIRPHYAETLNRLLTGFGGTCAVSGLADQDRELVDVILAGTVAQFSRLADALEERGEGLPRLGTRIQTALGHESTGDVGKGAVYRSGAQGSSDDPSAEDATDGSAALDGYPWDHRTAVMGILNVTPDSFHDGGAYDSVADAVSRAEEMVEAGADVIDVGGESTRPGADVVPVEEEIDRVVPVIEELAALDVLVSVDTRKAAVARTALEAGADILNDVSGLEDPEMRLVAAEYDVPVVVMHSIEAPVDPDTSPTYDDVVEDTIDALVERVLLAEKVGLDRSQIIVDPGLGFGKSRQENFELLGRLNEFHALGCPVLVGHSHKSMFDLLGHDPDDRLHATVGATAVAAERGADIIRVHDVAANVAAVRAAAAAADPDRLYGGADADDPGASASR